LIEIAGYGLRVAGYGLRVTGCKLRVAGCGLRVAGCKLRVAGCKLRVTGYELRARLESGQTPLASTSNGLKLGGLPFDKLRVNSLRVAGFNAPIGKLVKKVFY
jgi:hypothetical protein